MKLALAVTFLLVQYQQSESFLSKLGSVGNAMKAISSSLFSRTSEVPTATPGDTEEGNLMQQIKFMNSMLKKIKVLYANPTRTLTEQMNPMVKMMLQMVVPNFDKLNFVEDMLRAKYNYTEDQVNEYKMLFYETRNILLELKEKVDAP